MMYKSNLYFLLSKTFYTLSVDGFSGDIGDSLMNYHNGMQFATKDQVSISPTFYEQPSRAQVLCAAFMCLQFGFVFFWQKEVGAKAACKMLVKLTAGQQRKSQLCTSIPRRLVVSYVKDQLS